MSVLGRYSAITAAIVLVGVIAAAIGARLVGQPDTLLDTLAVAAFGIIAGTAGSLTQLNGTVQRTADQDVELQELRRQVLVLREQTEGPLDGR